MEKRVLIISNNCFSKTYNNGKTLEMLFSAFQKQSLSQLYFSSEEPDFDYCEHYYRITDENIIDKLIGKSKKCGGPVNQPSHSEVRISKSNSKFITKYRENLRFFRDFIWSFNLWKNKDLDNWLDSIKPQIIFFCSANAVFVNIIALYIQKRYNIPIVTYIADDYRKSLIKYGMLTFIHRKLSLIYYKKTLKKASLSFCISEMMKKEYETYFNVKFYVINTPTHILNYQPIIDKKELVMTYMGGLHLERWKMITKLGRILNGKIIIQVYSADEIDEKIQQSFANNGVLLKGYLSFNDVFQVLINSDILLHVESDKDLYRRFTRLAISTKIPEYLSTGRLILGFGPAEVASMRLLSDNNIGIVISSDCDENQISKNLNLILADANLRIQIGRRAHRYAIENYDIKIIAEYLKKKLESLF